MSFLASLSKRDQHALKLLTLALGVFILWQGRACIQDPAKPSETRSVEQLEQQYILARNHAWNQPTRQLEHEVLEESLSTLNQRLLASVSPSLAQAEMLSLVSDILKREGISLQSSRFEELPSPDPHYNGIALALEFGCAIEQFVNFMASLTQAPAILSTRRIEMGLNNQQTKAISVRMTLEGYLAAAGDLSANERDATSEGLQ